MAGKRQSDQFPVGAAVTIDQLADDLHPTLARLRLAEPVSWLPVIDGWLVTDYANAIAILRDPQRFTVDDERFTTGQVVGPSMLSTDDPEHRRHREPFEAMFRRGSVTPVGDSVEVTCRQIIGGWERSGQGELRARYAAPLAVNTIARFLGFHTHCRSDDDVAAVDQRLLRSYRVIVDTVVGLGIGQASADDAAAAMADLGELVDQATAGGGPLSKIVDARELPPNELRSNVAVILFGAIETCEGMTANAIGHVLGDEAVMSRLRARAVDMDRLVNESLRLEPAAAVVDRYATVDTIVETSSGPVEIAGGDLVEISLAGANRDPSVFPHPDSFDPDRARIGHHLSFARGPHVCLGLHLARLQTAVALTTLVSELPTITLDRRRSTPPRGHIFRKPDQVVARW